MFVDEVLVFVKMGNWCLYTFMFISKTFKLAFEKGASREIYWKIEEVVSGMGLFGGICECIVVMLIFLSFLCYLV